MINVLSHNRSHDVDELLLLDWVIEDQPAPMKASTRGE
jgi:hypothetical protein